jgi:hypothetical protein
VPGATLHHQGPAGGLHPVLEADQTGAAGEVHTADPVIADAEADQPVLHGHLDLRHRGVGVLDHVGQGLGDHVVGGHLDPFGQPRLDSQLQLDRDR